MTAASPVTGHNRQVILARGWFRPALLIVLALLALRLIALALTKAQLFVDESQYWLWGQELALGYYSKPPLIGWVIRLTTEIGGTSDFWVRVAAPICHAATALILAATAARRYGRKAAIWVTLGYMTLPFVALGSLLITTDTIMAPFYAAALFFWLRHLDWGDLKDAIFAGLMVGAAMMAKYAGVYFLLGAGLAALVDPRFRTRPAAWAALVAGTLAVLGPNLIWNATHSFVTLRHTADNSGWIKSAHPLAGLNPVEAGQFLLEQLVVFGPVLFAGLVFLALGRSRRGQLGWLALILVPLAVVTVQALMSRAYANWAISAYFPAIILVTGWLLARSPRLLILSLAVNAALSLAVPVVSMLPQLSFAGMPLMGRYLGREETSAQILSIAQAKGVAAIVSSDRDVLADLFYRVAQRPDAGLPPVFARPYRNKPMNYFELRHLLPADLRGTVLFIGSDAPVCDGQTRPPLQALVAANGAYADQGLSLYLVAAECLHARP